MNTFVGTFQELNKFLLRLWNECFKLPYFNSGLTIGTFLISFFVIISVVGALCYLFYGGSNHSD